MHKIGRDGKEDKNKREEEEVEERVPRSTICYT